MITTTTSFQDDAAAGSTLVQDQFLQDGYGSNSASGAETGTKLTTNLLPEDRAALSDFQILMDMLRTRTRSVALGFQNGVYFVGRPGTSKSYTITTELDAIEANYLVKNAKMTAPGLFELLHDNREKTIVLDDIPNLAAEKPALQILLAALGGKVGEPRPITYTTAEPSKGRRSFDFTGGIIAISNVPLRQDPLARAIASRIPTLEHEPTDPMLAAFMRFEAFKGYKSLTAEQCSDVIEFVIAESKASEMRLDLRSMVRGWEDFRQCQEGESLCGWKMLVVSSMKRLTACTGSPVTRDQIKGHDQQIAAELLKRYPTEEDVDKRNEEWRILTGKSFHTLLRHIRVLKGDAST